MYSTYLFKGYWLFSIFAQILDNLGIVSQIFPQTHKDDWQALAENYHFADPLP
jgi:hypothetical protein